MKSSRKQQETSIYKDGWGKDGLPWMKLTLFQARSTVRSRLISRESNDRSSNVLGRPDHLLSGPRRIVVQSHLLMNIGLAFCPCVVANEQSYPCYRINIICERQYNAAYHHEVFGLGLICIVVKPVKNERTASHWVGRRSRCML